MKKYYISSKTKLALLLALSAFAGAQFQNARAAITYGSLTGSTYTQNFDGMTTSASAATPTGWGFGSGASTTAAAATTAVTINAGTSGTGALTGTSSGGAYQFVSGVLASGTDKSIGFLSTGSYTSPKSLIFGITNNTGTLLTGFTLDWNYEKYRTGSRAFDWTFSYSLNGGTSYTSVAAGNQSYAADGANAVVNPPTSLSANGASTVDITGISLADTSSIVFQWTYTGSGGSTNGQGLGIDDFSLTAVPEPSTYIGGGLILGLAAFSQRKRFGKLAAA